MKTPTLASHGELRVGVFFLSFGVRRSNDTVRDVDAVSAVSATSRA
jgi:hypothetical protein